MVRPAIPRPYWAGWATHQDTWSPEEESWPLVRIRGDEITRIPFDLDPGTLPDPEALGDGFGEGLAIVSAPPALLVADDRSVWLAHGEGHWYGIALNVFPGVVRWDGERWARYLDGELVFALDVHGDGTATAVTFGGIEVLIEP